jgi:hypothetical protein
MHVHANADMMAWIIQSYDACKKHHAVYFESIRFPLSPSKSLTLSALDGATLMGNPEENLRMSSRGIEYGLSHLFETRDRICWNLCRVVEQRSTSCNVFFIPSGQTLKPLFYFALACNNGHGYLSHHMSNLLKSCCTPNGYRCKLLRCCQSRAIQQ